MLWRAEVNGGNHKDQRHTTGTQYPYHISTTKKGKCFDLTIVISTELDGLYTLSAAGDVSNRRLLEGC